jgi:hypothetical protein
MRRGCGPEGPLELAVVDTNGRSVWYGRSLTARMVGFNSARTVMPSPGATRILGAAWHRRPSVNGVGGHDLDTFSGTAARPLRVTIRTWLPARCCAPHDRKPQRAGTEDDLELPGHATPLLTLVMAAWL